MTISLRHEAAPSAEDHRPTALAPVRVAVVAAGSRQPRWVLEAIRLLGGVPAEVVCVLTRRDAPGAGRRDPLAPYLAVDRLAFRHRGDALELIPFEGGVDGSPHRLLSDTGKGAALALTAEERGWIAGHAPDVLLLFGFEQLAAPEDADLARLGAWRVRLVLGNPAATVLRQRPTMTALDRLRTDGTADLLQLSVARTDPLSPYRNSEAVAWKGAALPARALREALLDGALDRGPDAPARRPPTPPAVSAGRTTSEAETASLLDVSAGIGRYVRRWTSRSLHPMQWILGSAREPSFHDGTPSLTADNVVPIVPPRGRSWADPFPIEHDGRTLVFLEEWVESRRKAHISVAELGPDGRFVAAPEPVLEEAHHLSYPCVFSWQGAWFLMPESSGNRTLDLYVARRFPTDWELCVRRFEGMRIVDATPVEIDGRWWLFAALAAGPRGSADELHVYSADTPLGPWVPHPRNPVRSDVRGARPAGRPYQRDGTWYRPGQDGGPRYGHAVMLHRIEQLDESRYVEALSGTILPRWRSGLLATHTLNFAGGRTLIDGEISWSRWRKRW
jgi:hypothetical protein